MTKIDPITMPDLVNGNTTSTSVLKRPAPASRAASNRSRSMWLIELKIGTIMKMVNRCTYASTTEKSENSSTRSGVSMTPSLSSTVLIAPCSASTGIHEIMRITLEVQNGTVHTRNRPIATVRLRT